MGTFSYSPSRRFPARCSRCISHHTILFLARSLTRFASGIGAILLILIVGSMLLLFWAGTPPSTAMAATSCPISGLPPTPTSAQSTDPSSIKLNEILTNPKKDWDCDGDTGAHNQWIELANMSSSDVELSHLELCCYGPSNNQALLLSTADRISAHGFLVFFIDQIPPIPLFIGGGTLELLSADTGATLDTVGYPALGTDQSYARSPDGTGQWQISDTPTPGKSNSFGAPAPTPTPTKRSGSGGGGSDNGKPTATPIPIGTIFIPTDTPTSGVALQNPGGNTPDSAGGGNSDLILPSWLKITLIALLGATLLAVIVWYVRTWSQEPEGDA